MANANVCENCGLLFGWSKWRNVCGGCSKVFCAGCVNYALVSEDGVLSSFCEKCYRESSNLDFNAAYQVITAGNGNGNDGNVNGNCWLVFVHGGGGCRLMFLPHAKIFAENHGYNCLLLDLPGHGSKMNDPLTIDSACETILKVTQDVILNNNSNNNGNNSSNNNNNKPIYVGGSLGGYIGMEFLGRYPDIFSAAVITMCGQNVGVGRGMMASFGLSMMANVVPMMSAKTLLKGMWDEANRNGHIPKDILMETVLRSGFFFNQSQAQINILKNSNPTESLPKFNGPILFINGSRDHRDSEHRWLELSKSKSNSTSPANSKLIVYEGADHFFSHDDRYRQRFIDDMLQFFKDVQQKTSTYSDLN